MWKQLIGKTKVLGILLAFSGFLWISSTTLLAADDKNLDPKWVKSLFASGERKVYRGKELFTIGMPCGGICSGQLYVRGDGTLARWWIFNEDISTDFRLKAPETGYRTYRPPSRLEQGFAICATPTGGKPATLRLSRDDFDDIGFIGEYPIATIRYAGPKDKAFPLEVGAEVFSPFIPLNTRDSANPATVLRYTVINRSSKTVDVSLAGWLQHAAMLHADSGISAVRRSRVIRTDRFTAVNMDMVDPKGKPSPRRNRPVKLIENFERKIVKPDGTAGKGGNLDGWEVQGEAFGTRAARVELFKQFRNKLLEVDGHKGGHLAHSGVQNEAATGRLTSKLFTIERPFIEFLIAGSRNTNEDPDGATCLNLIVDGKVARTSTGHDSDCMRVDTWNVKEFIGRQARLEIVDTHKEGHVAVDFICMCDTPQREGAVFPEWHRQFGSMTLTALDPKADASTDWHSQEAFLKELGTGDLNGKVEKTYPITAKPCGTVASRFRLAPGEKKTVTFLVTWYFPNFYNDSPGCPGEVGRMYSNWYDSALDVTKYVAANFDRLCRNTHLFRDTLYLDTTLPYWLVERSAMSCSALASNTVEWWKNGRFYSFEGVGFCFGTCGHVWNYAQGPARLFPELERSVRTMQDYNENVSFKDTGRINFRGFNDNSESFWNWGYIPDAQSGYVLKAYRENLMSADYEFLNRLWPKIKKSTEYLIQRDGRYGQVNGILEGLQHLTDNLSWGPCSFTGSLYLAALRASEEMARIKGDTAFADRCHELYESGSQWTVKNLWNGEYFTHKYSPPPDGAIPRKSRVASYDNGCLSDQVFGQIWAHQLGLGYIYPKGYVVKALKSVFKYNWVPDVATVYKKFPVRFILLANEGEPGLFGCTYPKGPMPTNRIGQNDEPWCAYEYQASSHMFWEGLVKEGLIIVDGVNKRYDGAKHNPWCEIEGADHYSRSMASWGLLLGASGYIYDGPAGKIGFAPRITPDNFKCFFTAAEGWGSLAQKREKTAQNNSIEVRWGKLRIKTLVFELPEAKTPSKVTVRIDNQKIPVEHVFESGRIKLDLAEPIVIQSGSVISTEISY